MSSGEEAPPVILADRREQASSPAILSILGRAVEITELEFGDYAFFGVDHHSKPIQIGIEYKKVRSLTGDIESGRANWQLAGMLHAYDRSWVIINRQGVRVGTEGLLEYMAGRSRDGKVVWKSSGFMYHSLCAWDTARQEMGVLVKWVESDREVARTILSLYDSYQTPMPAPLVKPPDPFMFGEATMLERVALALSGTREHPLLGPKRAIAAAKHFGSIAEMVNASVSEWRGIEGFGSVVSKGVVAEIHKRWDKRAL